MTERLAALVILIVAAVYGALALGYPRGEAAKPGPGFYPLMVGGLLLVAAVAFLYETFRRMPPGGGFAALPAEAKTRVYATAGILAAFCLGLPWTGFVASTFVFVAVMLRVLGGSVRLTLTTAAASAATSYYVFAKILEVPLPKGVWFD